MRLVDIEGIARITRHAGVKLVVDNTFCTPYLQQPLLLGADVSLHSMMKFLGGHGGLTAGVAVFSDAEIAQQFREAKSGDMSDAVLSPHDIHVVMRGLKTLGPRMDRHCDNAMMVAEALKCSTYVTTLNFPGCDQFPLHDLAARQMRNFGGMISFELKGGFEAGIRFMGALQLVNRTVNFGEGASMAQYFAILNNSTLERESQVVQEIHEGLVQLSVGLENAEDIISDIRQALTFASKK